MIMLDSASKTFSRYAFNFTAVDKGHKYKFLTFFHVNFVLFSCNYVISLFEILTCSAFLIWNIKLQISVTDASQKMVPPCHLRTAPPGGHVGMTVVVPYHRVKVAATHIKIGCQQIGTLWLLTDGIFLTHRPLGYLNEMLDKSFSS